MNGFELSKEEWEILKPLQGEDYPDVYIIGIYFNGERMWASSAKWYTDGQGMIKCKARPLCFSGGMTCVESGHKVLLPPSWMDMKCETDCTYGMRFVRFVECHIGRLFEEAANKIQKDGPILMNFYFPQGDLWRGQEDVYRAYLKEAMKDLKNVHIGLGDLPEAVLSTKVVQCVKPNGGQVVISIGPRWTEFVFYDQDKQKTGQYGVAYGFNGKQVMNQPLKVRINEFEKNCTWCWTEKEYASWSEGFSDICLWIGKTSQYKGGIVWVICNESVFSVVAGCLVKSGLISNQEKVIWIDEPAGCLALAAGNEVLWQWKRGRKYSAMSVKVNSNRSIFDMLE